VAHIFSLNRSPGGVPKQAVHEARATAAGMEGDRQRDLRFHGGPERALCLFSLDHILALQAEGHPVFPGSTGENVTIAGLDWASLRAGTRVRLGDALVELTSFATPCKNISQSFDEGRIARISNKVNPGWSRIYAKVVEEGMMKIGDPVEVVQDSQEP
jgi:MOSC domain-containing protein YiiM